MKKILICCISIFVLFLFMVGATYQAMAQSVVSFLSSNQTTEDEEIGQCVYKSTSIEFEERTELKREEFEKQVGGFLLNVAMAMYEFDNSLSVDDVVNEINEWDIDKGIDYNLQNYKYDHTYGAWLISIDEKHSLSSSRRFFKEVYKGEQKDAYMYYLKVMNLINDDCNAIVTEGQWIIPMETPYVITQDYWQNSVAGGIHKGVDLSKEYGADIFAVTNAKVVEINQACAPNGGYLGNLCGLGQGNYVVLEVNDIDKTFYVVYMHMKEVNVEIDKLVSVGEKVGTQGHSGNSTGSHLHLEFRMTKGLPSTLSQYLDPHSYIDFYE